MTERSCCHPHTHACDDASASKRPQFDYVMYGSAGIILLSLIIDAAGIDVPFNAVFAAASYEFLASMWWGVALGILVIGIMNKIPREYFQSLMGRGDSVNGLLRAALAGLVLDLCSHGILMVGAKLYERGASTAQVMTFLIASPWNSISLTFILIGLIGLNWTLLFIGASALVAFASGLAFREMERRGILPGNPNTVDVPPEFSVIADARTRLKGFKITPAFLKDITLGGLQESQMLVRWILLGVVLAAAIRAFVPHDVFSAAFGPTMIGLGLTLVAATVIEVCSEGSAPIAAEIFRQAGAPGNAFAFLMAGVATDYTEIMVMREATKSWKIALALPLITVPQVLLIGWIMNGF